MTTTTKDNAQVCGLCGHGIIHHAHNIFSYQTIISWKVARKYNRPFIISLHGSIIAIQNKKFIPVHKRFPYWLFMRVYGHRILRDANAIIVNTQQEKDSFVKYCRDNLQFIKSKHWNILDDEDPDNTIINPDHDYIKKNASRVDI